MGMLGNYFRERDHLIIEAKVDADTVIIRENLKMPRKKCHFSS